MRESAHSTVLAALGWLTISLTIGWHCGWWLAPLGVGVGLLLAGLGLMARDAVASWALAYYAARDKRDGQDQPPPARQ